MSYSKIHKCLSDVLDEPRVLTNPERFLGPNYETVLNFWKYVESLDEDRIKRILNSFYGFRILDRGHKINTLYNKTNRAIHWGCYKILNACRGVYDGEFDLVIGRATYELIIMDQLLDEGYKMTFLPMFEVQ
jgi:hypothetical protein